MRDFLRAVDFSQLRSLAGPTARDLALRMLLLLLVLTGAQTIVDYYELRDVMFSKVEQRALSVSNHLAMRAQLDNDFNVDEAAQAVTLEALWNDEFLAVYLIDKSGALLKGEATSRLPGTTSLLSQPEIQTAVSAALVLERPQSFAMNIGGIDGWVHAAAIPGTGFATVTFVDL